MSQNGRRLAVIAALERVAFGFDGGEVVLGTRTDAGLETERLTAKPAER